MVILAREDRKSTAHRVEDDLGAPIAGHLRGEARCPLLPQVASSTHAKGNDSVDVGGDQGRSRLLPTL